MKSKAGVVLSIAVLVGVVYILDGVNLPAQSRLWREFTNAGHAPLFGVLSIAMLALSRSWLPRQTAPFFHYCAATCVSVFIGAVTEFVQTFTPRDASVLDLIYNIIGITSFLACAATFDVDFREWLVLRSRAGRNLVRVMAVLLFSIAFIPFVTIVLAHVHRKAQFPVIIDFESILDRSFLATSEADLDLVEPPPQWSEDSSAHVGKWNMAPGHLSAVTVQYPYPTWEGFELLQIDLFSTLQEPLSVTLRVDDVQHNFEFNDRFNAELTINPGLNHVKIPLADIKNAPLGRQMDMSSIASIILFAPASEERRFLYLDNIALH